MQLTQKAVEAAGTQAKLAERMAKIEKNVIQPHVSQWLLGKKNVSPIMAVAMEQAVDGAVTRQQFHPKLYA